MNSTSEKEILELLDQMCTAQHKRLLTIGRSFIPNLTEEDLLQPNDYPILENHPIFRYEEGVLEGLRSASMAINYLTRQKTSNLA